MGPVLPFSKRADGMGVSNEHNTRYIFSIIKFMSYFTGQVISVIIPALSLSELSR